MAGKQLGVIFELQRWSLHDGPGIRTNVFFKGCPLACKWCGNPESQSHQRELTYFRGKCIGCGACISQCAAAAIRMGAGKPEIDFKQCQRVCSQEQPETACFSCTDACYAKALEAVGRRATAAEVIEEVLSDRPIYESSGGGLTVTGGEPFAQPEFLLELLELAAAEHLYRLVETCFYAPWEVIESCLPYLDFLYVDIKTLDPDAHLAATGKSNTRILENLERFAAHPASHRIQLAIRTPVIPGFNDALDQIGGIADWISEHLPSAAVYELLPYHRLGRGKYISMGKTYSLPELPVPSELQMDELRQEIRQRGLSVKL